MATHVLPAGSTSINLQTVIDSAVSGDIVQISGVIPFSNTVTIRAGFEITIQSDGDNHWTMEHFANNTRHFEILGSLILEKITLDGRNIGGGVQLNQGAFVLNGDVIIQNCRAASGGGVYVNSGVFSIYGGEIKNNLATENGGGLYLNSGMFNMSSPSGLINSNTAVNGGGVYVNSGTFMLSGGGITNNEATLGGGLYLNGGTLSMNRGNFDGNTANTNGGGIYVTTSASLEITGTVISITNNHAVTGNGGGIYTANTTYANLNTGSNLIFRCNTAATAYEPPSAASTTYPNINFAETTITNHPLNNYDINRTNGTAINVKHNITYHPNGGIGSHTGPDVDVCASDTVLALIDTSITRTDHNFTGWNTSPDGTGTSYAPGDIVALTENLILYAQWSYTLCTVTYDANGGTGSHTDSNISRGAEYRILSLEETSIGHPVYDFIGWNTRPDGSGISYPANYTLNIYNNLTLYAQWQIHSYSVTYHSNGGTGNYMDSNIPQRTRYTILSSQATNIRYGNYTLKGWNTSPDGTGTAYLPGDITTITSNLVLYAQWTHDTPSYEDFCCRFCDEFCREFSQVCCCRNCHNICCKISHEVCCRLRNRQ